MVFRRVTQLCLTIVMLLSVQFAMAAEPTLLRYKFSTENPLRYRVSTGMNQTQLFGEREMKTSFLNEAESSVSMQSLDDAGVFSLNIDNERLTVRMENPGTGTYSYDSAQDDNSKVGLMAAQMTPIFDELAQSKLKLKMSTIGEIAAVEGYKELMDKILKKNPAAAAMAGSFTDESAKMQFSAMFPTLCPQPVKPGDKWETKFDMNMGSLGNASGKKVYTCVGEGKVDGRKTVDIDVKHDVVLDLDINQGLSNVQGKFTTKKSSGTIHFDAENGQILKSESKYVIEGILTVNANGNTNKITSSQEQTVIVELIQPSEGDE